MKPKLNEMLGAGECEHLRQFYFLLNRLIAVSDAVGSPSLSEMVETERANAKEVLREIREEQEGEPSLIAVLSPIFDH